MINLLSILTLQTVQDSQAATTVQVILHIQIVLIYIPIVVVIGLLLKKVFGYFKRLLKKSNPDFRLIDRNDYEFSEGLDDRDRILN